MKIESLIGQNSTSVKDVVIPRTENAMMRNTQVWHNRPNHQSLAVSISCISFSFSCDVRKNKKRKKKLSVE